MDDDTEVLIDFIEDLPIGIMRHDLTGQTPNHANDLFHAMFGWDDEEIDTMSKWFQKAYPDEVYRADIIRRWESLTDGVRRSDLLDPGPFDIKITCKDGSLRWCETRHYPKGNFIYALFYDIDRRVKRHEQLREAFVTLDLARKVAGVGIWDYDLVNDIAVWSDELYDIFEVSKDETPNMALSLQKTHPEDREGLQQTFIEAIREHKPYEYDFRIILNDGRIKYIRSVGLAQYDKEGDPVRALGASYDITDEQESLKLTSQLKERYENILQVSNEALFIMDTFTGALLEHNDQTKALLGYDDEAMQHLTVMDWDKGFETLEAYRKAVAFVQDEPVYLERTHTRKDGSTYIAGIYAKRVILDGAERFYVTVRDVTREKETQAELEQERTFLESLFQALPDLVWLKDTEGRYITCNSRFEALYGASKREIIGKTDYDFVPRPLADMFRKNDLKALHSVRPNINEEEVVFASDGHTEELLTIKVPMFRSDDTLLGVLGVGRDITELNHIRNNLISERNRFERYLHTVESIIVSLDIQGKITLINRKGCEILGYRPEELVGRLWFDVCLPKPEGMERIYPGFLSLITGELRGAEYFENEVLTRSGEKKLIAWHNAYLHDDNDKIVGLLSSGEDITDKREAEERLKLAASVFSNSREAIIITSADNKIIEVNQATERITGYTKKDLLGKDLRILSSGQNAADFYQEMWHSIKTHGYWSGEAWNRRKDGSLFAEMLTVSTVKDEHGLIKNYVGLFSDITLLKEQQHHLEYIAHYDALTGLPNRVLLSDRLQQAMAHANRNRSIVAVAYLDLDGFKEINDSYGHDAGDRLLSDLGDDLKKSLREGDTLTRIGGDEFIAVMLDLPSQTDCVPLLQRLLDTASKDIVHDGIERHVSASIGVSFYSAHEATTSDQLIRKADQAMYQSKLLGKNRFYVFDSDLDATVKTKHQKIKTIAEALKEGEFQLYYQPKVNMRSCEVLEFEALLRWDHPEEGLLSPVQFMPFIADHVMSIKMGRWVLEQAVLELDRWIRKGYDLTVSVNIDAIHLLDGDIVSHLDSLLQRYPDVSPRNLRLEILETSALEDINHVVRIMEACHDIGITFALDDFGTGYSSLTHLKRLPVSELKIDQSFVRDMMYDTNDLAILDGVISLADVFDHDVVAEGVETIQHGVMLLYMGCDIAQGYIIARPMRASNVISWMQGWQCPKAWKDITKMDRADLPILYAQSEHNAWFKKVMAYLTKYPGNDVSDEPDRCRFGQWLYSKGVERYGDHSLFKEIEQTHGQIHLKVNELVEYVKENPDVHPVGMDEIYQYHNRLLALLNSLIQSQTQSTLLS